VYQTANSHQRTKCNVTAHSSTVSVPNANSHQRTKCNVSDTTVG